MTAEESAYQDQLKQVLKEKRMAAHDAFYPNPTAFPSAQLLYLAGHFSGAKLNVPCDAHAALNVLDYARAQVFPHDHEPAPMFSSAPVPATDEQKAELLRQMSAMQPETPGTVGAAGAGQWLLVVQIVLPLVLKLLKR